MSPRACSGPRRAHGLCEDHKRHADCPATAGWTSGSVGIVTVHDLLACHSTLVDDNPHMLIADIGNVLIRTHPGAHYRALADLSGLPVAEVKTRIERGGLSLDFDRGAVGPEAFAERLRQHLAAPDLSDAELRAAWNTVIGDPVPAIVSAATTLGGAGRLALASNINPWHWPVVRDRLTAADLPVRSTPAVLSFEVGYVKPEADFFRMLLQHVDEPDAATFVDDRSNNVRQARTQGLDGWVHTDDDVTATRIREIAATSR